MRREGAERFLLLMLVAFAATVIVTRVALELTGFPRIGGGDLHIAHALWGGACLFVASVLPILLAGSFVYRAAAVLSGIGIGLFIDEVGKFITTQNDYFYPAAAPIIYATFLLSVLIWIRARRPNDADPRSQLLSALELLAESVEGDLQPRERDQLLSRLGTAAKTASEPEQRRLAEQLLAFVAARDVALATAASPLFHRQRAWWAARRDAWIGGRGLRVAIVVAVLVSGAWALVEFGIAAADLAASSLAPTEPLFGLRLVQLGIEAIAGLLMVPGAILITVAGRHTRGYSLVLFGLLVSLTLGDLISFYLRQFDSIVTAGFHAALLAAVVGYRRELESERVRPAP
ncbi:MAG: hypothetical protein ABI534_01960 [Chloroflexota bacterium]